MLLLRILHEQDLKFPSMAFPVDSAGFLKIASYVAHFLRSMDMIYADCLLIINYMTVYLFVCL